MRINFKSILSLSILVVFVVCPILAISLDYKDKNRDIATENITKNKEVIVNNKEVPKKKEDDNGNEDVPKKETEKETREKGINPTPTPKTNDKSVKKIKKVNKKEQKTKKDKSAFHLSSYERKVIECMVMGESGGEPYKGQLLVAFCILNACKKDGLQPSEVRKAYKYSGWNDNPSKSVKRAVRSIFDDGHKPVNDTPLYFYAPKHCDGAWHETQRHICTVGGHKFFGKW